MRTLPALAACLCLALAARGDDAERAKAVAEQKKAAAEAYKAMEVGEPAFAESKHLLVYAPQAMEKRLKAVAAAIEKYHDTAAKALGLGDDAYPGKVTVYLFAESENLPAFLRRVEKRRPEPGETGSYSAADDRLHAVAVPGGKGGVPAELRAGEMVAALLMQRKAGARTELPAWLTAGFARATSHRAAAAKFVADDRKAQRLLVKRRNASDAWGGSLEGDEAGLVQASVAEMLVYGATAERVGKFLNAFKPEENVETKTTAQALEAAGLTEEGVNKAWKRFVK